MNVLQLLTTTNIQKIVEAHNEYFPNYPITVETYRDEFLSVILRKIPITNSNIVEISHRRYEYNDPIDNEEKIDVSLIIEDVVHTMQFNPWGETLGSQIRCDIHFPFTLEQQAAHIYWEMTWHGMEEETEEKRDQLLDAVEELERVMSGNDSETISHKFSNGIKVTNLLGPINNVLDDLLSDFTESEKEEMKKDAQRKIANYKTVQFYKNGILQVKE